MHAAVHCIKHSKQTEKTEMNWPKIWFGEAVTSEREPKHRPITNWMYLRFFKFIFLFYEKSCSRMQIIKHKENLCD